MRALTVVVLVAVAAMLVVGCGPKKEELPPLEPAEGQPAAAVAVPGGAAKSPVTVETMPPPPVAKPRPMTPAKPSGDNPPVADPAAGQSYEVKAGDTLYTLAKRFYGDGKLWTRIADANKDKIKDVSHIPIGTTLTTPPK